MELLPTLWIKKYQIKTETGNLVTFQDHPFLYDIYNDFSPNQVILKAAQIGFSTLAILKSLYIGSHKGLDMIYTLPTSDDVKEFVGGKVNRIIANNPILGKYAQDHDTIEQKRVCQNMIYYKGTWTERAALMVSSDLNIYDEEDRSKKKIIEQYASRLQHSPYKWEWHFSNPSTEGNGVSAYWEDSSQSHWFIKCEHCSKRQYISWPESIDRDRKCYICKKCGKEIQRTNGEWVKKYTDKDFQGYWISLLMAPWISAEHILEYEKSKDSEYFYNFVLGLPYVGSGNKVTLDVITRNLTSVVNDQKERIVIGVDPGIDIRYVVGNKKGLFHYGQCGDWDDIERLMQRWDRSILVCDAGGDIIGPRKLREKYQGRVFLCHYARDRKTFQLIRWGEGNEFGNVVVDRNRMIQLVIDELIDKRIPLQGTEEDWWDYWLHWSHIYKVREENSLGVIESRWERSDRDDWAHSTVYWRVGMDRFGAEKGDIIQNRVIHTLSSYEVRHDQTAQFDPMNRIEDIPMFYDSTDDSY